MRKPRVAPTREERIADLLDAKLDRLRDPLVPQRPAVKKKRPKRTPDDLPRWDYSGGES